MRQAQSSRLEGAYTESSSAICPYSSQDQHIEDLVSKIKEIRDRHDGNGFVHASYSLARKLRLHMRDCEWAVFHEQDKRLKQSAYDRFSSTDPSERKVMIGSGFTEGVDMHEDIARWQVIAKIPYPSLADPAMRWVAKNRGDVYNWMVSRDIMQAAGRVCRSPEDYGVTYVLDNAWDNWYNKSVTTLPRWFRDAIM